jgi:hypothetical protein
VGRLQGRGPQGQGPAHDEQRSRGDPKLFAGKTRQYYGRWTYKYEIAAKKGAAGAIIIHTEPSAGYKWQVVTSSWSGENFSLPAEGQPEIQVQAWATEEASRRIARLGGRTSTRCARPRRSATSSPCRSA